ncbi:MAG: hypothetical protein MJ252_24975, partial [archaeon]|nr:hypothetical protein [archaeon]
MSNDLRELYSEVDKKVEEAKKFINDFYQFLLKKGRASEIKELTVDFSVSKKNTKYKCDLCKASRIGMKYVCNHCNLIYCQRCFDINKFMNKHTYTFYADNGFDDMTELMSKHSVLGQNNVSKTVKGNMPSWMIEANMKRNQISNSQIGNQKKYADEEEMRRKREEEYNRREQMKKEE